MNFNFNSKLHHWVVELPFFSVNTSNFRSCIQKVMSLFLVNVVFNKIEYRRTLNKKAKHLMEFQDSARYRDRYLQSLQHRCKPFICIGTCTLSLGQSTVRMISCITQVVCRYNATSKILYSVPDLCLAL